MSPSKRPKKGSRMKPISTNWHGMRKNCGKRDAPNDYCGNRGCHGRKPFAPSTQHDSRLGCNSSSNGSRVGRSWNKPAMSLPWASRASAKAMLWLPLVMSWSACVILDDIGYVQQDRDEMEVLFTFLAERYEHKSVMITTNLVFSEWQKIFK